MRPRILLLSAYDADSHRYWHHQLIQHLTEFDWQLLALSNRFFSWRMAANALNFQHQYPEELSQIYDLVVATSMTDLVSLRGLYPHLSRVPNILYFHENQFAYPDNPQQQDLATIQLRSLLSSHAADVLIFNSDYNLRTFIQGGSDFLKIMPDAVPKDFMAQLKRKSQVIPVPLKDDCQPLMNDINRTVGQPLQVVWNHRWEHDKGPETLLELLKLTADLDIQFHILGQRFRQIPQALKEIMVNHSSQCLTLGYVENRADYLCILQTSDVVLSTAQHDFQGIAMLEAVACGCRAVAPKRLVYPDLYPTENLYPSTPDSPIQEATAILRLLLEPSRLKAGPIECHWSTMQNKYQQLIQSWL